MVDIDPTSEPVAKSVVLALSPFMTVYVVYGQN